MDNRDTTCCPKISPYHPYLLRSWRQSLQSNALHVGTAGKLNSEESENSLYSKSSSLSLRFHPWKTYLSNYFATSTPLELKVSTSKRIQPCVCIANPPIDPVDSFPSSGFLKKSSNKIILRDRAHNLTPRTPCYSEQQPLALSIPALRITQHNSLHLSATLYNYLQIPTTLYNTLQLSRTLTT